MASSLGRPTPGPAAPNVPGVSPSAIPGPPQGGPAALAASVAVSLTPAAQFSRQRVPLTVDPFGADGRALAPDLIASRTQAVSNLYLGMQQVHTSLNQLVAILQVPFAPPQSIGTLVQPDGTSAGYMQVQFDPSTLGNASPKVTIQSDQSGSFHLPLPSGMKLPAGSIISLLIHGANASTKLNVPAAQIAANGLIGAVALPQFIAPLPTSILAALQSLVAPPPTTAAPPPPTNTPQIPVVKIGDDDDCLLSYGANNSIDRFPFGVFFRLVEPRASIVSQVQPRPGREGRFTFLPNYASTFVAAATQPQAPLLPGALPDVPPAGPGEGQVAYVDRVPVEQPISVDGFRDQMMGLEPNGTFTADEKRPMAGTLGLGYVLWMAQRWTFQGLALGNLVYSLPLAPGEQQQVAIFERVDTARVAESEFFTEEQAQQQRAVADTSTQATFNSAFSEAARGTSSFQTNSDSSSWGVASIIASGGSGSSSASGSSAQSLEGQRNTSQQAAQNTHSAAENQASARRSAARTGMRVASASESQQVTTKVITNHNHTRALTMQYWEVQRLYDVTTAIDGLTLTVLVPLQVVRFMPHAQPLHLTDAGQLATRAQVLTRYGSIVKHGDVLLQALPRRYRQGLTMLLQFAADPTAGVEGFGGTAEDVIQFSLDGSFLTCEDVSITVVTDRGTRVGPVNLANSAPHIPDNTFASRDQLIGWLTDQRQAAAALTFKGALALPRSMNRSNVVGFEIGRNFRQVVKTLISPEMAAWNALQKVFGVAPPATATPGSTPPITVYLTPAELEETLGGPRVLQFQAAIDERNPGGTALSPTEQYANESLNGIELPPQPYPVPALQLAPVLRYNEILEIEKMASHVVRCTLTYSRAIWASMSTDERAILLEAYTIGVPPGGVADATQMVPLLNCVENRVLGYFGNSMILPFNIPESLAQSGIDGARIDSAKIQEAILAYQTATFIPPRSTIALPTRGVLGEAVLGHCASAEKIDLTRFWNWQDSPADTAPAISATTLPTTTPSVAAGLTGPNSLTALPSLINNVLTAPAADSSLAQALGKFAESQKDFSTGLTGADQLAGLITNAQNTANSARADALKTTKDLHAQSIATVGNIVGGIYGNPNAGSGAASSVYGKGDGGGSSASPAPAGGKTAATGTGKTGTGGATTGGATTGGTTTGGTGAGPNPTPAPGPPSG